MTEKDWGSVRIRQSLLNSVEEFLKENPNFGNNSTFVSYLINRELKK